MAENNGTGNKQGRLDYFASKNLLERARETLQLLMGAKKSLALYPPHHQMCSDSVLACLESLRHFLETGEDFILHTIGGELFFADKLMARESFLYYQLIKDLEDREIGGFALEPGLTVEEMTGFLQLLNADASVARRSGFRSLLTAHSIEHVSIDEPDAWEQQPKDAETRANARSEYINAVEAIVSLADQALAGRSLQISKANHAVGAMLNRILENRSSILGLSTIKSYDEYTSYHSVNVLILALALGSMLPLDRDALLILGTGALLHDIGKVIIPAAVLNKPGPLTDPEWELVREHPVRGADLLVAQPGVHPLSVITAYEHHVRYDLQGFPRLRAKNHAGLFSLIVQIADCYDAMTTDRPYKKAMMPDRAIRVLAYGSGTQFDPLLVKVFIDMMGFYPVGTLVRLESGELGVVYGQGEGEASHPLVKLVGNGDPEDGAPLIDLGRLRPGDPSTGAVEAAVNPLLAGVDVASYF